MTPRRYRPGRQERWVSFNPAAQPGQLDEHLPTRTFDESAAIGSRIVLEPVTLAVAYRARAVA